MKKVFGILIVACICIALGLSVRWSRDRGVSLVDERALSRYGNSVFGE